MNSQTRRTKVFQKGADINLKGILSIDSPVWEGSR